MPEIGKVQPMPQMIPPLAALLRETVRDPQGGARRILALGLPEGVLWQALVAVVSISVLLTQLGEHLVPPPMDPLSPVLRDNPMLTAVVQGGLLAVMVYAIHFIGRGFGGRGSFAGALALTVWLQVLMVALQVVQTLFLLVLPPVAGLIGLAGIFAFFWFLSHFVAALHGFASVFMTFMAILASMFGIVMGMSVILLLLGIIFGGGISDV